MPQNKLLRMEKDVIVGKAAQLPMRLIVELMPDEVYSQRMRKVNKGNKKKGYHTGEEYSKRARFNLFVTNVSADTIPAQAIPALYKLRWQVELVFKVWKSTFGIDNTRKMKYNRWICLLYARLLVIAMSWCIIMMHRVRFYSQQGKLLSVDKCFKTLRDNLDKFRKAIRGGSETIAQLTGWITNMFSYNHWLEKKKKEPILRTYYTYLFVSQEYMCIFSKKTARRPVKYISLIINKLKFFGMSKITTKNPVLQRNGVKSSYICSYSITYKIKLTAMGRTLAELLQTAST